MRQDLSGKWTLASLGGKKVKVDAMVPTDTHSALLKAGAIKDPYWAKDEIDALWVGRTDWSFSRSFRVDSALLAKKAVYLVAEQIDTVADILINGKLAGTSENMFVRFRQDVKKFLKAGENTIEIRIKSGVNEAARLAKERKVECRHGVNEPVFERHWNQLRKVACHSGWDWGVCLVVAGIYNSICLQGVDDARIEYVYTDQKHEKGSCKLTVNAELLSPAGGETDFTVEVGGQKVAKKVKLQAGINKVSADVAIKNPELWYPAGYGKQPLYDLKVKAGADSYSRKLGLRKLEVDIKEDKIGRPLTFKVNGVSIYCKGADWIPADGMPGRYTREMYEDLIRSASVANMNMLRVWGGGQYENDDFYELCDQYGLLIWHDFMFACAVYPAHDRKWLASVKQEVEHQIKRLRDYASIALWCGDNENLGGVQWSAAGIPQLRAAMHLDRINFGIIETAVLELDPARQFWYSSPCAGPDDLANTFDVDKRGDMHFWRVWHGSGSFEAYYAVTPRFCSEFGFQSLPSLETISRYAPKDQWNITAPVFDHHQRNGRGNSIITEMMTRYFRVPEGFANFAYLSQVQQALAIKTGVEYWRTLRPVCMGALYWQLNDNWPVCSWSSIDHGGKWKLLNHAARRFYAPLMAVAFRKDPEQVELWVVNDHTEARQVEVAFSVRSFDGKVLKSETIKKRIAGESSVKLKQAAVSSLAENRGAAFVFVKMKSEDGVYENVAFLDHPKRCTLADAKISFKAGEDKDGLFITIESDKPSFYVSVETMGADGEFDDNMIALMPGSQRKLRFNPRQLPQAVFPGHKAKELTKAALEKAITIRHLRGTYA